MINFNSLQTRLVIVASFFAIIIITAIIVFYVNFYINNNNDRIVSELKIETEKQAIQIQAYIEKNISASLVIASTFEQYEKIPPEKRRNTFHNMLHNNIKQNDDFFAIWTKFKPFTIDNLDTIFRHKLFGTNGQYIKCFYRQKSEIVEKEIKVQDEIEFEKENYIKIFHDNIKSNIKAPVLNRYTPSFIDSSYLISIYSAIYSDSKFIGIVGIDINVEKVVATSKNKINTGNYYILDENQNIVYSKNKKYISKNFKNIHTNFYSNYNIEYNLAEGNTVIINEKFLNDDKNSKILFVPLNIDKSKQNWALVRVINEDDIVFSNYQIWISTMIIAIIFFLLTVIIIILITKSLRDVLQVFIRLIENLKKGIFIFKDKKLDRLSSSEMKNIKSMIDEMGSQLTKLEEYAMEIKNGNLEANYTLLSPEDRIGHSLMNMRVNLIENKKIFEKREKEDATIKWISDSIADFGIILRRNIGDFDTLTFEVISNLVKYLNAVQGGIFTYNDDDKNNIFLELAALFAYNRRRYETKRIKIGDGLLGTCALEKKIIHLKKIPDNYVEFSSGLGTAKPKTAIIVPLVYNDNIYGVFEIAKLDFFLEPEIEFVEKVAESIASSFASEKISSQTNKMLEKANFRYEQMLKYENNLSIKFDKLQENFNKLTKIDAEKNNVINALNEIVLNLEFDESFKVIRINSNFLRYIRQSYEEAMSKNYYELFDIELLSFEEHSRRIANLRNGHKQDFILKLSIQETDKWLKCIFNPIYDADRKISHFILLAFDHTEFIKKDKDIIKINEELQTKIEHINIMEIEIENIFNEMTESKNEIEKLNKDKNNLYVEIEKQEERLEFYKKELEKRMNRFKKIEDKLKEKNKLLEEELKKFKN